MSIKGRLFRVAGETEVELRLDMRGVADLKLALNRALNCWDPQQRPMDLLDLCDKLDNILEESAYDKTHPSPKELPDRNAGSTLADGKGSSLQSV